MNSGMANSQIYEAYKEFDEENDQYGIPPLNLGAVPGVSNMITPPLERDVSIPILSDETPTSGQPRKP